MNNFGLGLPRLSLCVCARARGGMNMVELAAIWKARNMVCFEEKLIKNPIEIFFFACAFIRYWRGLYPKC
jgi:hypothetical protein